MPFETDKESSTMRSSLAEDGSKPETKLATFSDPPKQEALVAAAKSGEELAFEALVKRHQPRIFALALRYTRVPEDAEDRKSTRLNSSHRTISYAVFCLKKKKIKK